MDLSHFSGISGEEKGSSKKIEGLKKLENGLGSTCIDQRILVWILEFPFLEILLFRNLELPTNGEQLNGSYGRIL